MKTAKKICETDDQGVGHVDEPGMADLIGPLGVSNASGATTDDRTFTDPVPRAPFLVLALVTLSVACGGGSPGAQLLTRNEVTDIAAGSAHGQSFLGTYQMDLATQTGCKCHTGACADFRQDGGNFFLLQQDNGSLTLNGVRGSWRGLPCVGGVDADGSFSCGDAMADSLYLMRGHLSLGGGQATSMSLEEDEIVRETDQNGLMFDCDIHLTGAAHRIQ